MKTKKLEASLDLQPMCESCCSMPYGSITVFDGFTYWCSACAEIPERLRTRLQKLEWSMDQRIKLLHEELQRELASFVKNV
jgi:hypothetical protein